MSHQEIPAVLRRIDEYLRGKSKTKTGTYYYRNKKLQKIATEVRDTKRANAANLH